MRIERRERGQVVVEFAVIGLVLMMLTVGLVDVGRAFYGYNAVSVAARYAARWGSVVGGTCTGPGRGGSISDWCNQFGQSTTDFWNTLGNYPLQGNNSCPTTIQNPPSSPNPYYTVSPTYTSSTSTTIVGAVAQKFDTNSTSTSGIPFITGALTPGFDLSQMLVCIQLPPEAYANSGPSGNVTVGPGYLVTVYVYYPFKPLSGLFGNVQLNLIASSQYEVEGF